MVPRPDLLMADSPGGIAVFQLTTEGTVPSSHVYMEAQVFTPDSGRLVLHRSAHPHGCDPKHRHLLCELKHHGELSPLTGEVGAIAPAVTPDGTRAFFNSDESGLLQAYMVTGLETLRRSSGSEQ